MRSKYKIYTFKTLRNIFLKYNKKTSSRILIENNNKRRIYTQLIAY